MPTFSYKGLQADGKIAEGVLEAAGRPDALRQMETLGLRPVNLAEKSSAGKKGSAAPSSLGNITFDFASKKVSTKELENFTRLLSSLLAAGIVSCEGAFEMGDLVGVVDETHVQIARGLTNYAASELDLIRGKRSDEIEQVLGYKDFDEVIHRDNLVLGV